MNSLPRPTARQLADRHRLRPPVLLRCRHLRLAAVLIFSIRGTFVPATRARRSPGEGRLVGRDQGGRPLAVEPPAAAPDGDHPRHHERSRLGHVRHASCSSPRKSLGVMHSSSAILGMAGAVGGILGSVTAPRVVQGHGSGPSLYSRCSPACSPTSSSALRRTGRSCS